jgi:hypothetical protein
MLTIKNNSPDPFTGWVRCNTDSPLVAGGGTHEGGFWVRGLASGRRTHHVHVWFNPLPAGATVSPTLTAGNWDIIAHPPFPAYFGALPEVAGVPMILLTAKIDGPALVGHFRARVGPLFVVDLRVRWYAETPWYVTGTAQVSASNSSTADMEQTAQGLSLRWGPHGIVSVFGAGVIAPLLPDGYRLADGQQAPPQRVTVAFWQHLSAHPEAWQSVHAIAQGLIVGHGIEKLLPLGNPRLPASFDREAWLRKHYQESVRRLRTTEAPVVGVVPNSGVSGAQEDQLFVGGESL